ncbi:MAG: M48 family metallopeptidase [Kiritimatiellaeota bacterium]|nr:M48 family metallopeptidase [Kiritimatiellota bacterium]
MTRRTLRRTGLFLVAVGLLTGLGGCQTATEPFTGRSQLILTSPSQEMQAGLQAWRQVTEREKPCRDRWKVEAVRRVGQALSRAAARPDFNWEFRVFESDQANAFCLPGGKVGVYSGLFKYVANDAELAAVVGHEIGHAIARHGGERMTQAMLLDLGALGLSMAVKGRPEEQRARWLAAYTGLSTVGVVLPFSRRQEYSADEIGLMLMAKAGYDPEAAIEFWRKFAAKQKTPAVAEFLSTHPLDNKRLQRLRNFLPKAILEYEMAPNRRGLGQRYRRTDGDDF